MKKSRKTRDNWNLKLRTHANVKKLRKAEDSTIVVNACRLSLRQFEKKTEEKLLLVVINAQRLKMKFLLRKRFRDFRKSASHHWARASYLSKPQFQNTSWLILMIVYSNIKAWLKFFQNFRCRHWCEKEILIFWCQDDFKSSFSVSELQVLLFCRISCKFSAQVHV